MASNEISMNLDLLVAELEPKYLRPAMEKACVIVRNDAVQNAPSDTGELRRSIDFQVADDGAEGVIYSNVEYAPYVEFGTGIYASRGGGRQTPWTYRAKDGNFYTTSGMAAQPFLEPALEQNTSAIAGCFANMF